MRQHIFRRQWRAFVLSLAVALAGMDAPAAAQSGRISIMDFGARCDGITDDGAAITAANAYAASVSAALVFPGGQCEIGAAASFTIDPMKTRWRSDGVTRLHWKAAPASGVAISVVSSSMAPYNTAADMAAATLDGIEILGGGSAGAKYAATGLRIGDGIHQTFSLALQNLSIQGWATVVEFENNVWWISFNKARLLWGEIRTPAAAGNWGESMTFHDTVFADGATFTVIHGDWKLFGGSLDNAQIIANNNAHVAWFGAHIENPGTVTLTQPFIDVQGEEATVHLIAPTLVINNAGTPMMTAPFNVARINTGNGLIIDGVQYTQGAHAGWYSMVSGGGRVHARSPQILAFENQHYQVFAENARGQLANYGFESAPPLSGWRVTSSPGSVSSAQLSSVRAHTGTNSAMLRANAKSSGFAEAALSQNVAIGAGDMLMLKFAFSRSYAAVAGTLNAQVRWIDAAGGIISTSQAAYASAGSGTDDGATWQAASFNGAAPGGTVQAQLVIALQRLGGFGSASLYIDDVYVNVVD